MFPVADAVAGVVVFLPSLVSPWLPPPDRTA
jgi:hypothetical protein